MDWLPNDDAMKYFVRAILPRIRVSCPEVVLTIVGRKPFPSLTALGRNDPNIRVTGQVGDVRPYLGPEAVVIPLRIGGGTRLKVFEAVAMEKAVVSTSIGVEGLPIVNGTDVLVADEPDAFADAVVQLLQDRSRARPARPGGCGKGEGAVRVGAPWPPHSPRPVSWPEGGGRTSVNIRTRDRPMSQLRTRPMSMHSNSAFHEEARMRISVFGLGYVGCVSSACFSDHGHEVIGVDTNPLKVEIINDGRSPVVEPGVEDLIGRAVKDKRVRATTDATDARARQ